MATFLACVLLDQAELPDAAALAESLRRRYPGLRAEPSAPSPDLIQPGKDVQTLQVGDQKVMVSLIRRRARPNPFVWAYAIRTWPDVLDVAGSHQAHLLVSTIGRRPAEPLIHAQTITATVGSILDILLSASTVVWAGQVARPAAIWRQDSLKSFAPSPDFPLLLWVDILPIQAFRGIAVSTNGLMTFCKHDIQMPEGTAARVEIVRKAAHHVVRAISRNNTIPHFTPGDDEDVLLSDAMSKRIDALASLEPMRLGQGPLLRLPRPKALKKQQEGPKIFEIAERHADKALDLEIENLDLLLAGSSYLHPPEGKRGFPAYSEIPRLIAGKRRDKRPLRDLEQYHDYWLVSDRLKAIFEAIDSDAFAFQACEVRERDGLPGPQFWLCDVTRTLDPIDEETAKVIDHDFERGGSRTSTFIRREELSFQQNKIGDRHIFRIPYCRGRVFCDQHLKDACRASGLKVRFEPTYE